MRYSAKRAVLENFLRKHLSWSLLLIKIQAYTPANLLHRHSNTGVFLTVIPKFLRTAIFKNICERLLLRVFPFMLVWTFAYMNNELPRKWRSQKVATITVLPLEILQNSRENTCARVSFLLKLQILGCNFLKKETGTGV